MKTEILRMRGLSMNLLSSAAQKAPCLSSVCLAVTREPVFLRTTWQRHATPEQDRSRCVFGRFSRDLQESQKRRKLFSYEYVGL